MITGKRQAWLLVLYLATAGAWAVEEQSRSGTVTETMNAGQYTYMKLDEQGTETWLATLQLQVSPGEKVEYIGGDIMQDFHSKTLDRTFESIRFVTRIHVLGRDSAPTGQAMPADAYHKNIARKDATNTATVAPQAGDIARVEGGRTVAEIMAAGDTLAGQTVRLRARVVKANNNIMGKNWITLQDGTGTAPDDKLTVTTAETVPVGAQATVEGIVRTNVNLGSGYLYKVLLEDAKFTH